MASTLIGKPSPVVLAAASAAVAEGFQQLRERVREAGPLDVREQNLILLSGFTVARKESGFKSHARRALEGGATADEVRHAVLLNLGAVASIELVADALRWADEVISARTGT
jgi:4-carboxymuconolactone decarboxylase